MLWPGCHCPHINPVLPGRWLRPSGWYPIPVPEPTCCREHRHWHSLGGKRKTRLGRGAAEAWTAGDARRFRKALA